MQNKVNCKACKVYEICVLKNLVEICEYFDLFT